MKKTKNVLLLAIAACSLAACLASPVAAPTPSVKPPTETLVTAAPLRIGSEATADPLCQVEEEAGFTVNLPATLPDGYTRKDVRFVPEYQAVTTRYVWDDPRYTGEMLFITQQTARPKEEWPSDVNVETVEIGECEAQFVRGDWWEGEWQKDAPVFRLRWVRDGFFYTLMHLHNETSSAGFLDRAHLVELATQMVERGSLCVPGD
ncbi:MAG: hypothetical protein ACOYYS_20055 [Chloroflexota bacterium]